MLSTIIISLLIILLIVVIPYIKGKNKPSDQRNAWEKIICSLFVIGRANMEETANSVRSARVMKTEALQEVNDALISLDRSYKENKIALKTALKRLEEQTLPKLRDMPGTLEAKARKAKKDYEKSVESGNPIDAYRQNAYKFLQHKRDANQNIDKAEKMRTKLQVTIDTESANYEGRKIDLEMIKTNLECTVDIPRIELNESLSRIRSLQTELSERMNEDSIRSEVEDEIRNEQSSYTSSDFDNEFDKL